MPPKAGVPFPHELGSKLGEATIASLSAEDPADRWIAVLEAAAFSPIRTQITPAAAPAQPAPELIATVTRLAPLLPQIAALFGIEVPEKAPVPKPLRPTPRKKESPKASEAVSRHGKVASHPGPKKETQAADTAVEAQLVETTAAVVEVVDAPQPEVAEVGEAPEGTVEVVEPGEPGMR